MIGGGCHAGGTPIRAVGDCRVSLCGQMNEIGKQNRDYSTLNGPLHTHGPQVNDPLPNSAVATPR